jgi:K(+)-stimulated pyrophosphate-energized sodium pump
MTTLWLIVLCGVLALIYAIWATSSVLRADAGSARMQEIAAAVREGAQAYLRRQYTTIAVVGVVIFIIVGHHRPSGCRSSSSRRDALFHVPHRRPASRAQ